MVKKRKGNIIKINTLIIIFLKYTNLFYNIYYFIFTKIILFI